MVNEPLEVDEYEMNLDDDEDELDYNDPDDVTIDSLVVMLESIREVRKWDYPTLRETVFTVDLEDYCSNNSIPYDSMLFGADSDNRKYVTLIHKMFPKTEKLGTDVFSGSYEDDLLEFLYDRVTYYGDAPVIEQENNSREQELVEDDLYTDTEVVSHTMRIMNVYKDLFEVGFDLNVPYGVLVEGGMLTYRNGSFSFKKDMSLARLYGLVDSASGGYIDEEDYSNNLNKKNLRNISMTSDKTYYPSFQLGNLFGIIGDKEIDNWADLSKLLEKEVKMNLVDNLKKGQDIVHIANSLTTAIVISEFDPSSALLLRISVGNGSFDLRQFNKIYDDNKTSILAGNGDLFHSETLKSGVTEISLVMNETRFIGKPLFAYEAVEKLQARGKKPSISNFILGQDTSGRIVTENLDTQQSAITLIGAGQRAGKGVLTLNMLGTVLASGSPLIYLDGKPDMAEVLWEIGKKYGHNTATWDAYDSNGNRLGVNAPELVKTESSGIFGILAYLKVLQMMMVAANLQSKGETILDGTRPFFIFDEALAVQSALSANSSKLISWSKDKSADPEVKAWATDVLAWLFSLTEDLKSTVLSQLPKAGISTVWLFQSVQITSWNQVSVKVPAGDINPFRVAIQSKTALRLLGRGTLDSEYGLSNVKNNKIITKRIVDDKGRHFARTTSQKVMDMDAIKVFKPYLVLNNAEDGTSSAEELKKNLTKEALAVVAPNGSLDSRVGFEGFASMLGEDAINNLSKGRAYLEDVMSKMGLSGHYNSIEEYIYDGSIDSFKSLAQWVNSALDDGVESAEVSVYNQNTDWGNTETPVQTPVNTGWVNPTENDWATPASVDPVATNSWDTMGTPTADVDPFADPYNDELGGGIESVEDDSLYRPINHIEKDEAVSPNKIPQSNDRVYSEPLNMAVNPFDTFGTRESPVSALNALKQTSDILMEEILRLVGDYSRVHTLEICNNGMIINGIMFRPQFPEKVINGMPYDIRVQVRAGNIIELFNLSNVTKFRGLEVLRVDNPRLAEGRLRKEIGLHPRKGWYSLFKRFPSLQELYIGGERITDEESSQGYDRGGRSAYEFKENLREKLKVPASLVNSSRLERVWNTRPVKVMSGAVGATLGVKVVSMAALAFGPWGLLFGAFAGYGAYREIKKSNRR